jgi:hypothetical protein
MKAHLEAFKNTEAGKNNKSQCLVRKKENPASK